MKVVVSGATGFLGGHLATRLKSDGHDVIGLGRNLAAGAKLTARGIRFVPLDLFVTSEALGGETAEAFVHSAALASNWATRTAFYNANVVGTANALALARRLGVSRFVHISTPTVYFRFADQLRVREDMVLPPPVNLYAETKAEAEVLALSAPDLSPIVLRPRGIYGPGDTALLPRLVRAARRGPLPLLRDGRAVIDMTHVEDVVAAIVAALKAGPAASSQKYNVSGGEPLPVKEIAERAAAKLGVRVRWRGVPIGLALAGARAAEMLCAALPGRPEPIATAYALGLLAYSQTLDISAAKEGLGWSPRIGFAEGLTRT